MEGWVDLSSGGAGTTLILSIPLSDEVERPAAMPDLTHLGNHDQDPTGWGEH